MNKKPYIIPEITDNDSLSIICTGGDFGSGYFDPLSAKKRKTELPNAKDDEEDLDIEEAVPDSGFYQKLL